MRWRFLLLEHFYFTPLLSLTHLVTLGFLSSLMMGMLYRLAPMLLGVEARSRNLARIQLVLFLVGAWGLIAHFWIAEWTGMSWSAGMLWVSSLVQLWNFRELFRPSISSRKGPWPRRFVASSLVHFFLAASLGLVLGLLKGYGLRPSFLADDYLANVFAHAHLAGVGWVLGMIFGFQLKLVPTTEGASWSLPIRFALLQGGTLGLAAAFLLSTRATPFALALALACGWQTLGPLSAFAKKRAREWELLALLLLCLAAVLGIALSFGLPDPSSPARARAQLAYGFLGLFGFMGLTVVSVAFKLFPIFVWKDRFQPEYGKNPVPGMKDLPSQPLRVAANLATCAGSLGTAAAIFTGSPGALTASTLVLAGGIAAFVVNLALVLRWSFLD
ncbi:MAG TPA: hypothetical protein VIG29_18440 [Vicinamibacteria bacterium]